VKHILDTDDKIAKLLFFMDRDEMNLVGFLYLRRINYAWATCSSGTNLPANRIMCALAITSPRARTLLPSEEKAFFQTAVVLTDGYNVGQRSTLNLLEYVQIAYLLNYLSDYELQLSENVRVDDVLRGIQEGTFPVWVTRSFSSTLFEGNASSVSFSIFCGSYYALRLFKFQSLTAFLDKD